MVGKDMMVRKVGNLARLGWLQTIFGGGVSKHTPIV